MVWKNWYVRTHPILICRLFNIFPENGEKLILGVFTQEIAHGYTLSINLQDNVPELCWDQILHFVFPAKDLDLG